MIPLTLGVRSGLCSRLRPVLGAIGFCESQGRRLIINWPTQDESEKSGRFPCRMSDIWRHPYGERDVTYYACQKTFALSMTTYRTNSFSEFLPYCSEPLAAYLDRMTLQPFVADLVAEMVAQFRRPVVGVNIRYEYKPPPSAEPQWFIQRLKTFRDDVQIFVSTDDPKPLAMLCEAFPGRVLTIPKSFRYDRDGIRKAAADLYVLKECDWMIGANHSSFSQMAALMRGALFVGEHERPGGLQGGRYEDLWNPAEPPGEFLK